MSEGIYKQGSGEGGEDGSLKAPQRLGPAAHISHFTTKRLKSRKQSVIGVVAIMFTKTLKGTKSEKRMASGARRNKNKNTRSEAKLKKLEIGPRDVEALFILYFFAFRCFFSSSLFCMFLKRESCTLPDDGDNQ